MRRTGNLFEPIVDRENLRLAFSRAVRGKRSRPDVRAFASQLDARLQRLSAELAAGTMPFGRFHQFTIHDPKERIITAPCFEERVLHHAVMNVCEPVFERWLVHDSYACRKGKGRIAALLHARHFARRYPFFLKCDIRKYFDSIPHSGLLQRLERIFKDERLLALFRQVVSGFRGDIGYGLPIGSLTSQHFANFYLGWLDRFVKEKLRVCGYVRYMDDFALWGDSSAVLQQSLVDCAAFLDSKLKLTLKPHPFINRTEHGMDFLGCRVFRQHLVLNRRSRRRFEHSLRHLERRYQQGEIDEATLQQRATALVAFTTTEGLSSWQFRSRVIQDTW